MKKTVIILVGVSMLLTLQVSGYGQEVEGEKSIITTEKKRILILPSKLDTLDSYLIENEVTSDFVNAAVNLGRFDVFDQYSLDNNLLQEALLQGGRINTSMAKKLGQDIAVSDALIVSVVNFSQVDIPEYDEDDGNQSCITGCLGALITGFCEWLFFGETHADNVETLISVEVRKIDVETGEIKENISLKEDHTGGSWEKSRKKTLKKLNKKIVNALKSMYPLSSEITSIQENEAGLFFGEDIEVSKRTVFEIVDPEGIKIINEKPVSIPGHRAGFVTVSDDQGKKKQTKIIRQWLPFKPEYRALEYIKRNHGLQIEAVTPFTDNYWSFGIQYHGNALKTFDWGGGLRFIRVTDSYGDSDNGFSFGGFGCCRFINNPKLDFGLKAGLDIDLIFRDDDLNNNVSAIVFSMPVGLCAEILLSAKSDFVIDAGYRIGGKTSEWTYSSGENSHSAFWNNDPPQVDISGFYFSVGFRFLLF